ncbi:hypothetical protein GCM10009682_54590 [Luedemannella flava]|uniref:Methylamine utilisation protein MauE domain-containing protein n=1 Tax=Luedemannella flava TaxID=349316 RepID=A0ABN2MIW6_9ACTN
MLVVLVVVLTVAAVLLISLVSKLRSATAFGEFRDGINDLRVVPRRLAAHAAVAAVAGELVTLGLVLVPATTVPGLFVAGTLFAVFAGVLSRAVIRGAGTSCHCFGATKDVVSARHVARTALLALLAYGAGALSWVAHRSYPPTDVPTAVIAVAVAGVLVVAVVYLDAVMWLFGSSAR